MTMLGAQPGDLRPDQASGVKTGALPHPSIEAIPGAFGVGFRLIALAALTVTLIALCVVLAVPLLPAISWAVALAILAWPMHRRIARRVARPELAAALCSAIVVILILGTVLFVTYQLAREAATAVEMVGGVTAGIDLRERATALPIVGRAVSWMQRSGLDIEAEIRRWIASYTRDATALAQGSLAAIIQFLVAVFIFYHLLRDQAMFVHGLRELLPLSRAESDLVLSRAGDSIHANLHATVVTSVIDTTGFGLLFWALGLPAPILWSVVMFILSILPVFGAGVVWVPTSVYLALTGQWLSAVPC
ncbi:AI-2E family transporter [Singulisphaera sp. Ch08]|uniref:AI-2E family transporter n=1 Tax=Singulisphaera sp. Ch08 TaxID=3120278 RepID=A0AAU7CEX0_9BACT